MKNLAFYLSFLVLLILGSSCGSSRRAFNPENKYSPAELQGDYRIFRHVLEESHPSLYWYTSRDSMDYYFDKGYAALKDSMTEPAFRTVLSYVIAKVRCGHTSVRNSRQYEHYQDTARPPIFPLILKFWPDTMVVTANLNRQDSILRRGVVLESINGRTAAELEDTLSQYVVTDGYNLTGKYQYLSTGFHFGTWYRNVFGDTPVFRIRYYDRNQQLQQTVIPLYDPVKDTVHRLISRIPRTATEPPRKRRRQMDRFYTRNLQIDTATRTAFMSLNTFEHGNHLVRFFHQSFRSLDEQHIANLVIDVRSNGGGDASNSNLLTRYLIDRKFKVGDSLYAVSRHGRYDKYIEKNLLYRMLMTVLTRKHADGKYHFGYFESHVYHPRKKHHFDGSVYILTGGNSFSATSLFAGALKGQKNVTLVGEETGGGFYGNTAWMIPDVTLPATGVRFRLPRFRLVVDKTREKTGRGISPDVPALPSPEAIGKGLDFKTARVKELISTRNARQN